MKLGKFARLLLSYKQYLEGRIMSTTYGYVRVSSQDQNEDRRLIALREKLVDPKQTFIDKQSGKDFLLWFGNNCSCTVLSRCGTKQTSQIYSCPAT